MTRTFLAVTLVTLLVPASAFAQSNSYTDAAKAQLAAIKTNVIRTAEKVSEDLYAFKPTPDVRSLGQLLAHIADGNFGICGAAAGMKPPMSGIEKSTGGKGKAAIQKALAASFEFCESAWASMDATRSGEMTKTFLGTQPRFSTLQFNTSHVWEHYGNLVTYMRLKGIVPPSSEPSK
jgi:uncharacterized damage-inducible protein DinB